MQNFIEASTKELKRVRIYSTGSCDTETRNGSYETLLEYNENRKYFTRKLTDTTVNRCIIQGLIDGVQKIKFPCHVTLVTSTTIGLSNLPKIKGPNVDVLSNLLQELNQRDCQFEVEVLAGHADDLKKIIRIDQ